MHYTDEKQLAKELIDYCLSFPLPTLYGDILREQIEGNTFTVEQYPDCVKILFDKKADVNTFPLWLPTLLQGCQILKESGPISCHLFVENGYVVQFEIVDMGLNEIDWDFVWHHEPVFDIEYDSDKIIKALTAAPVTILKAEALPSGIDVAMVQNDYHWIASFRGCTECDLCFKKFPDTIQLLVSISQSERRYCITSCDGAVSFQCSEMYLSYNHQM